MSLKYCKKNVHKLPNTPQDLSFKYFPVNFIIGVCRLKPQLLLPKQNEHQNIKIWDFKKPLTLLLKGIREVFT